MNTLVVGYYIYTFSLCKDIKIIIAYTIFIIKKQKPAEFYYSSVFYAQPS